MKPYIGLIAAVIAVQSAGAQIVSGLTGIRDTSYSNYSAYESTKRTHPFIRPVLPVTSKEVSAQLDVVYSTAPGRNLYTDIFYPSADQRSKHIAVLIIHGGGWRTGNRTQHHALAQQLAARGYICITPEYRLSTEALFPAAVYDLKEAIRWVKNNASRLHIDTARIAVAGFSAGGELAAFLGVTGNMPLFEGITQQPVSTQVGAVVDMDGILSFTHPESGEGDDSKRISAATYWFGYPRKEYEKLWEAGSSLSYISAYTPPTLFLNSSVDRMHAGRNDYIKALDSFHTYTEVHTFDKAPHGFPLFEPWFTQVVNYIDTFLEKVFAVR